MPLVTKQQAKDTLKLLRSRNQLNIKRNEKLELVGSFRRDVATGKDVDIITNIKPTELALRLGLKNIKPNRQYIKIKLNGIPVDLFYGTNSEWPFLKLHYIGNKLFNIIIRKLAKEQGYKLNQHGLFHRDSGKKVSKKFNTERSIFDFLGMKYHTPKERNK